MTTGILFLWSCSYKKDDTPKGIEHIVIIGVDGMSPNGIQRAHTPMMDSMIQNGGRHHACPFRIAIKFQSQLGQYDHGGRYRTTRGHFQRMGKV